MTEDVRQPESTVHGEEASPARAAAAVNQPSKYSIERILALEEYTRTKSLWLVFAVLFVTPLPALIIVISYQIPPLQPVEAGWQANWVFFVVRLGVGAMIMSEGVLVITRHLIPELQAVLHARIRLLIAVATAVVFVLTNLALAFVWGFPVPFATLLANPTGCGTFLISIVVLSRHLVTDSEVIKPRLVRCFYYITTAPVMAVVYPAYIALFLGVDQSYRPLVMLLIPVIKTVFRKLISTVTAEWEDLLPVLVTFSIELFNSLYQVICVQNGGSIATTAAAMTLDLLHAARSQWKLHHSTTKLQKALTIHQDDTLLVRVCGLCEDTAAIHSALLVQAHALHTVKLRSALSHSGLSVSGHSTLASIEKIGGFSLRKLSTNTQKSALRKSRKDPTLRLPTSARVLPWGAMATAHQDHERKMSERRSILWTSASQSSRRPPCSSGPNTFFWANTSSALSRCCMRRISSLSGFLQMRSSTRTCELLSLHNNWLPLCQTSVRSSHWRSARLRCSMSCCGSGSSSRLSIRSASFWRTMRV